MFFLHNQPFKWTKVSLWLKKHIQKAIKRCTGDVQEMYRRCTGCTGYVQEMYTGDVQEMYRMYRRCTGDVQKMYRRCTGDVQEMYRMYRRCTGITKNETVKSFSFFGLINSLKEKQFTNKENFNINEQTV